MKTISANAHYCNTILNTETRMYWKLCSHFRFQMFYFPRVSLTLLLRQLVVHATKKSDTIGEHFGWAYAARKYVHFRDKGF